MGKKRIDVIAGYVTEEGMSTSGRIYHIPIFTGDGKNAPIEQLRGPIRRFLEYARENDRYIYVVSRLGCRPYGYDDFDVAPYFADVPDHVLLPSGWSTYYQNYENKI